MMGSAPRRTSGLTAAIVGHRLDRIADLPAVQALAAKTAARPIRQPWRNSICSGSIDPAGCARTIAPRTAPVAGPQAWKVSFVAKGMASRAAI